MCLINTYKSANIACISDTEMDLSSNYNVLPKDHEGREKGDNIILVPKIKVGYLANVNCFEIISVKCSMGINFSISLRFTHLLGTIIAIL